MLLKNRLTRFKSRKEIDALFEALGIGDKKDQTAGLLSPVYAFTDRGGCWFCPNAKRKELRHLYDHHPELWAKMLELQAMPGKVSEKFNRTERFSDIDAAFRKEDALCQKAA